MTVLEMKEGILSLSSSMIPPLEGTMLVSKSRVTLVLSAVTSFLSPPGPASPTPFRPVPTAITLVVEFVRVYFLPDRLLTFHSTFT